MTNWLLMFKPETYEIVKERGIIGALHMHRRRFAQLADGDRFVAYLSRRRVLDGYGTVVGEPFEDIERIFPGGQLYPQRCRVAFERAGADVPAGDLLWGLDAWEQRDEPLRTQPSNMLFCYGGFMAIPESDRAHLVAEIEGKG